MSSAQDQVENRVVSGKRRKVGTIKAESNTADDSDMYESGEEREKMMHNKQWVRRQYGKDVRILTVIDENHLEKASHR